MSWQEEYKNKLIPVDAAAALIESGDKIGMSTGASMPIDVLEAICRRRSELEDVTIISGIMMPPTKERTVNHLEKKYIGHINHVSIFLGAYERVFLKEGNVGVIPT